MIIKTIYLCFISYGCERSYKCSSYEEALEYQLHMEYISGFPSWIVEIYFKEPD